MRTNVRNLLEAISGLAQLERMPPDDVLAACSIAVHRYAHHHGLAPLDAFERGHRLALTEMGALPGESASRSQRLRPPGESAPRKRRK